MGGMKLPILMILAVLTVSSAAEKWWKSAAVFSSPTRTSSIKLTLHGNVYPDGFYYAQVFIGKPPKPYSLDPDTGSDLTWLQCDAPCHKCTKAPHPLYKPSNDFVGCKDPLCASLHSSDHKCETEVCDYGVHYADGGSSLGILLNDVFSIHLSNGTLIDTRLALGCGHHQEIGHSYHSIDGVLGLGKGKTSILSQLKERGLVQNVVGHCLSGQGGGYLFFGDQVYDASKVIWTSMSRHDPKHYSPGSAELIFYGTSTRVKNLLVIFDSGSSYSYLHFEPYQALISSLEKELRGKPLIKANDDNTLPLCWKGMKPFKSVQDVNKYFKPFALRFANGWKAKSEFEISPELYLIISLKGNVCLGVLNGTEAGLPDINIIGDISMQDKMVIYDNEKKRIGWTLAKCDPPKSHNIQM